MDSLLTSAFDYTQISLNDGGIRQILNSGDLNLIDNEYVRIYLASFDERLHNLRKFEDETQYTSRKLSDIIDKYYDDSRGLISDTTSAINKASRQKMFDDASLKNKLSLMRTLNLLLHQKYIEEKITLDSLKLKIDNYLSP